MPQAIALRAVGARNKLLDLRLPRLSSRHEKLKPYRTLATKLAHINLGVRQVISSSTSASKGVDLKRIIQSIILIIV
jgi:hypothetical protein